MYGLCLRAIYNYEVNFRLFQDEEFVLQAQQTYGYKAERKSDESLADVSVLFARGELSEDDMDAGKHAL